MWQVVGPEGEEFGGFPGGAGEVRHGGEFCVGAARGVETTSWVAGQMRMRRS